uniref:exodeoxyribonuclease VII large subunit n=1 Tax=Candidatus Ventrenecus sp. TaxID=3085654 RepID=UPI003FF05B65
KYKDNYILNNPKVLYQKSLERYSDIKESLQKEIIKYMNDKKQLLYYTIQSLKLLNPLNILEQGYSIVKKDNEIVKNTNKININDKLDVTLAKGTLKVKVEEINYERNDV